MARRKKRMGSIDSDELERALAETKDWKPPPSCTVKVGESAAAWSDTLTPSQCAEFPPGKDIGRGSFAKAYEHAADPTKIVKFTFDPIDASVSRRLVGKSVPGAVGVYKVRRLTGKTVPEAEVRNLAVTDPDEPGAWVTKRDVPVYGIVADRVSTSLSDPQYWAVNSFWTEYSRARRSIDPSVSPKTFTLADIGLKKADVTKECGRSLPKGGDKAGCKTGANEIFSAVENMAQKAGVIPLDLHDGNWGVDRDGRLVILDLGVSREDNEAPSIEELAGMRNRGKKGQKNMAKKKQKALGALPDGMGRVLALAVGAGALVWILWPKKAKAQSRPAVPVPTPAPGAGEGTTIPTPSTPGFEDPATGVVIAGPSTPISPVRQTYTVQKGESWANIASRTYGDYRWWPYLWDENRSGAKFANPDSVKVGDVITIAPPPPDSNNYRTAIFERAAAHRAYWIAKKTNPALTMPQIVYVRTPQQSDG